MYIPKISDRVEVLDEHRAACSKDFALFLAGRGSSEEGDSLPILISERVSSNIAQGVLRGILYEWYDRVVGFEDKEGTFTSIPRGVRGVDYRKEGAVLHRTTDSSTVVSGLTRRHHTYRVEVCLPNRIALYTLSIARLLLGVGVSSFSVPGELNMTKRWESYLDMQVVAKVPDKEMWRRTRTFQNEQAYLEEHPDLLMEWITYSNCSRDTMAYLRSQVALDYLERTV